MSCAILHKRSAKRDSTWNAFTQVESKGFVKAVKPSLRALAKGRKSKDAGDSFQLREPSAAYGDHFGVKNEDIEVDTPIFRTLINKYQRDSLARPHFRPILNSAFFPSRR